MNIYNPALEGSPFIGYLRFAIPSLVGLLVLSAAPVIDGLFIANFLGVEALAAVNLLIPVFSILFGISYMLGIGGSVSAGKYIGEYNKPAANNIFGLTVIASLIYGVIVVIGGLLGSEALFKFLGAEPDLFPYLHAYFDTLLWFMPIEFLTVVMYYFVRIGGHPTLVTIAIIFSVITNISLNYLFLGVLGYGLEGAAIATGIAAIVMVIISLGYRFSGQAWLAFKPALSKWRELMFAAYNGISDFINEISAGVLIFVLNLIIIGRYGADGVAAFGVVNYSLLIGILVFFGYAEAMQAVCSQCFGAKKETRMKTFMWITMLFTIVSAVLFSGSLLIFGDNFIGLFASESEPEMIAISKGFIAILWPVFIFIGLNIVISAYLTTIQRPGASAIVSSLRALILPLGFLYLFLKHFPEIEFMTAILLAELIATIVAAGLFIKFRPSRLFVHS